MSDIILKAENLTKQYGDYTALDSLSVEIPRGSLFGLLGPNGAGKTTFIRLINQILIPTSGSIFINGEKITREHISKIGYMPEERGLYKNLTVMDQAMYLAQLKGLSASQAKNRIHKWLAKFDIENWADKKIQELSKGMAQKVQFIINVLHEPEFMILDEPFSGFDPINAEMIRSEIEQMCQNGTTVLFSTHRMESVEQMCSHILLINKGKGVLQGEVSEIKDRYKQGVYRVDIDIVAEKRSTLEALPEFVSWEEEKNSIKPSALFKVQNMEAPNELLSKLTEVGQIHSFAEVLPSINDIFFTAIGDPKNAISNN
ncbi:MAG: ATP-binding cassette domain-containing protein [Flavobacteriales bacterium]|nr:ATP-binding cassette domain-containing protein [Flavobacteriales bacterium]